MAASAISIWSLPVAMSSLTYLSLSTLLVVAVVARLVFCCLLDLTKIRPCQEGLPSLPPLEPFRGLGDSTRCSHSTSGYTH